MAIEHEYVDFEDRRFGHSIADGISSRLRNSSDRVIRKSTCIGFQAGTHQPVLVPDQAWANHCLVLGPTQSGKTSLAMMPIIAQRIRQRHSVQIIIDLKGDWALFQGCRRLASEANRKMFHITSSNSLSTYLFNPLEQKAFLHLDNEQKAQKLASGLSVWHGMSYGRGHFSGQALAALIEAFETPISSNTGMGWSNENQFLSNGVYTFRALFEHVRQIAKKKEFAGSDTLVNSLRLLAFPKYVNFPSGRFKYPASAIESSIQLHKLLQRDRNGNFPVLYLYLPSESDAVTGAQITRLFIALLQSELVRQATNAKMNQDAQQPPNVDVFIDEFQNIADNPRAFESILVQGSGQGIRFFLANQDISQLKQVGPELLETVWENCQSKIIFGARSTEFQERIMKLSGEKTVYVPNYGVAIPSFNKGNVSPDFAVEVLNDEWQTIGICPTRSSRFERNQVIEQANKPGQFIFFPPQAHSICNYGGFPIMVDGHHQFSFSDYEYLKSKNWPDTTEETIITSKLVEAPIESAGRESQSRENTNQETWF